MHPNSSRGLSIGIEIKKTFLQYKDEGKDTKLANVKDLDHLGDCIYYNKIKQVFMYLQSQRVAYLQQNIVNL